MICWWLVLRRLGISFSVPSRHGRHTMARSIPSLVPKGTMSGYARLWSAYVPLFIFKFINLFAHLEGSMCLRLS